MPERTTIWGGSFEIITEHQSQATCDGNYDKGAYRSPQSEEEVKQSWLLRPGLEREKKNKKKVMMVIKKCMNNMMVRTLLVVGGFVGFVVLVAVLANRPRHHPALPGPDNYTVALHQSLMFFDAQRSGRISGDNNVSWRGDSCLKDGNTFLKGLVGGYYDGGNAIKFSFPASFAMTMLSWSVIEYSAKYEAAGELKHVKNIIKWGTDYLLKTFKSSAHSISIIASYVGGQDDLTCWVRPEEIQYKRPVSTCSLCPALAAEMAAALASASIVFKDNKEYSKKLVRSADTLFKFATKQKGEKYADGPDPPSPHYNSTGFWDEFVWGGTWLYFASGKSSYLDLVTKPALVNKAHAFWEGPDHGVLSWDNKHAGAQLLLTRLRMFLPYGYPSEVILREFHDKVMQIMCSYLPDFRRFSRTRGGLIQLNHGKPRPLQYVVNAAFLATLYSDYLEATLIPGWHCGNKFYKKEVLRDFAKSQINYILGKNPRNMSYVVGFGAHFPQHVHHRGASIPDKNTQHACRDGNKWRNTRKPNPNTIVGAMVGGPYKNDNFKDVRSNYTYTEPTIAGNAGLVAALVALSAEITPGIDKNTIFYAVPPLSILETPPPPPWVP